MKKSPSGPYGLTAEHEAKCRRCGASCHLAIPVNGIPVVVPGLACKFLAQDDRGRWGCTVYERRFDVAPWCQRVEDAERAGFLAQDCPYVAGKAGYRGKVFVRPDTLAHLLPTLRAHIAEVGAPHFVNVDAVLRLLEGGGGRWEAKRAPLEERVYFRERP